MGFFRNAFVLVFALSTVVSSEDPKGPPPAPITTIKTFKINATGEEEDDACVSGDCVDGSGEYVYKGGGRYTGQFKNGKKHGEGTYVSVNNDTYEGEYVDDRRHGKGTYTFADGEIFERQFVDGKSTVPMLRPGVCSGNCENGNGLYTYETGDWYDGSWVDGWKDGYGLFTFRGGIAGYKGEWKKGEIL